jgi:hypothetical protein
MAYPTLTARWSNAIVATWAVPPATLAKYLPAGPGGRPVELDLYTKRPLLIEGKPAAALSLVAMQCTHVKIYGVRWPRISRYTSIALRVCVKQGTEPGRPAMVRGTPGGGGESGGGPAPVGHIEGPHNRGFVYIRELVSSRFIAWFLRRSFNQPILPATMEEEVKQQTLVIGAEYRVLVPMLPASGAPTPHDEGLFAEHMIRVVGTKPPVRTTDNSLETWLTERPFVFGLDRHQHPRVHEVIHPRWSLHESVDADFRTDFATLFGPDFAFMSTARPRHTMLSPGSATAMFPSQEVASVRWGVRRAK